MTADPVVATLVVDLANVMGSRPDGWWRDRAGAAARLLAALAPLAGRSVAGPADGPVVLREIVAIVEGRARDADVPPGASGLTVVLAPADGDTTVAEVAAARAAAGEQVLVVTADRGLRARLPEAAQVVGPGWVNALIGR
ncbi:hypothetical protein ACDF64_09210 [Agromyces sp. MMS24-JH15]|uniref:hypothetical protein n=1 Tax=Agromyces sp. MMS24-JH15 TaxID=3243765 RepID=UPI003749C04A